MGQEDSSRKGRGGKHFTYEQRVSALPHNS